MEAKKRRPNECIFFYHWEGQCDLYSLYHNCCRWGRKGVWFRLFLSMCTFLATFAFHLHSPLGRWCFRVCFQASLSNAFVSKDNINIKGIQIPFADIPLSEKGSATVYSFFGKLNVEHIFWYYAIQHSVNMTKPSWLRLLKKRINRRKNDLFISSCCNRFSMTYNIMYQFLKHFTK